MAKIGTKGEVGSVTGNFTLSSEMGGNFSTEIFVLGNLINLVSGLENLTSEFCCVGLEASIPSPASLVGEGIRCFTATMGKIFTISGQSRVILS